MQSIQFDLQWNLRIDRGEDKNRAFRLMQFLHRLVFPTIGGNSLPVLSFHAVFTNFI